MTAHGPDSLLEALGACERVLLTGPTEPDGDSVGACLALQRLLRTRGVQAAVAGTPSYRYAWMPGADAMIPDEEVQPSWDAVVVLDGDRHRLTDPIAAAWKEARLRGIVDHHASTRPDGYTHAWLEGTATSTCQMIYEALRGWGDTVDRELAILLYVGAIFDTGCFRYSNTTSDTHRMAAHLLSLDIDHADICARVLMERRVEALRVAGAVYSEAELHLDGQLCIGLLPKARAEALGVAPGDLEGLVDTLAYTDGVEVSVLLVERSTHKIKASLRSRGRVNVARVAQELSDAGGGHAKAAGAILELDLEAARRRVVEVVTATLGFERASAK